MKKTKARRIDRRRRERGETLRSRSDCRPTRPKVRGHSVLDGFSLVEILLAFTILLLGVLPIFNLLFGTSRMHTRASGVFREAVAGQLVWESMKASNQLNKGFLRNLEACGFERTSVSDPRRPGEKIPGLVHLGTFVDQDGPRFQSGPDIALSPLVSHLINRTGGGLYDPANRETLSSGGPTGCARPQEIDELRRNFQDLAFRVTVTDGLLCPWSRAKGVDANPERTDLVKDVVIEVFRAGPGRVLPSDPAYRLETAIETPPACLSDDRLAELDARRDTYDYEKDLKDARRTVSKPVLRAGGSEQLVDAVANLLLIIVEATGESVLSRNNDFGFVIVKDDSAKGTDRLVDELLRQNSSICRRLAGDLLQEKARGILMAYRRSEIPMKKLYEYTRDFSSRVLQARMALSELAQISVQQTIGDEQWYQIERVTTQNLNTVKEAQLWVSLFQDEAFRESTLWPLTYPKRFCEDSLTRALEQYRIVEADQQSTPMERIRGLNSYTDVVRGLKLFLSQSHLDEERLITKRAAEYRPNLRPYAQALEADEVHDLTTLIRRNAEFHRVACGLKSLELESHPYRQALLAIHPTGTLAQTLNEAVRAIRALQALRPQSIPGSNLAAAVDSVGVLRLISTKSSSGLTSLPSVPPLPTTSSSP